MAPQDASGLPAIIPSTGVETYRMSTDAANICGAIVKATAKNIQGRNHVMVEGWQAIAIAHGCAASSGEVEWVDSPSVQEPGGYKAVGEVRRMDNGALIAKAEGFVGTDEATWFGGEAEVWDKQARRKVKKVLPKRPAFAIKAMAQTRAISRACRSAFAHVVVMIDRNLSTTPAEEMQGIYDHEGDPAPAPEQRGGWAGSNGDVDPQDRELTARAPKFTAGQLTRMKKWLEGATGTLKLTGQSVATLDAFWNEHSNKLDWLLANMPDEHAALDKVYLNAREAARAREPNAMQAG